MKNKWIRFLVGSFLTVVFLIVGTALIAPHFIKVDKYRTEIVQAVNNQINGNFSLGNLKLDLWGKIAVSAENADLKDSQGKSVLSVGRFFVKVPFISLLKFSPEVRVELDSPQINLERAKKGNWNVLSLVNKTSSPVSQNSPVPSDSPVLPDSPAPSQSTSPSGSSPTGPNSSPAPLAFLARTKVSLQVEKAALQLKDDQTQNQLSFSSVFLRTGELSLQSVPEFEAEAQIKTKSPQASLEGPVRISGKNKGTGLDLFIDLNDLKIEKEGVFTKKAGVQTNCQMILHQLPDGIELKKGEIRFHEATLQFDGQIRPQGASVFRVQSEGISLPSFESLLVAMPKGAVAGKLNLNLEVKGPLDQLQAQLKSRIDKFSFQSKAYPKPVKLSGELNGQLIFRKVPQGEFNFYASSVDAAGIEIRPVKIQIRQQGSKVNGKLNEAQTLGGKVRADFAVDTGGKMPHYTFSKSLQGIQIEKAVSSQMEAFKNTLFGTLDGFIEGKGESFDPEIAKKNLKAQGKLEVKPARFSTIDINKVISEVSVQMAQKLQDQVPQLKGKKLKLDPVASEFKRVTASFQIKDGEFIAPDFFAESIPQKGVDIRGSTKVGISDYRLTADWEITDPYNVTRAKDLNVDLAGMKVNSILVEKGKAFRFPIKVRGTLLDPKYEYGAVPEALAQVALKNISGAAQEKAKGEAKKKAQQELQKLTEKAPAPVKNLLKGLFK